MPLKVLHVIHNLKREGAQTMVVNLATSLDPERAEAVVFPWRSGGPHQQRLEAAGVRVLPSASGAVPFLNAARALRKAVREGAVDVVHAHMSDSAILAAAALAGVRTPLVVTHHSNRLLPNEGWAKHRARRLLAAWAMRRAAFNIGVTPNVSERLRTEFALPSGRAIHIANGVPVPSDADVEAARADRLGSEASTPWPRLATVGRLAPVKRQDIAVDAVRLARASLPHLRLRILGEGPLAPELAGRIESHGLGACVDLAGPTDDVAGALRQADVYLSTSAYEGLPIAVLEAMSWSLPVIATEVPGHRDVIRNGIDGCLVPFDDPQALAQEIVRLCASSAERDALGRAARERAVMDFSASRMADAYCDIYRTAAEPLSSDRPSERPAPMERPGLTRP